MTATIAFVSSGMSVTVAVAVLATACAIVSAIYWWRASCVQPVPTGGQDSGEQLMQLWSWTVAILRQSTEAAHLNAVAARWAAAAALLGGASAILENSRTIPLAIARLL
jgi:hypothetical protein